MEKQVSGVRLCALCRSTPLRVGLEEDTHMGFEHGYTALYSFNGISDGRYALVGAPDEFSYHRDFGDIIENKHAPPSYYANVRDTTGD